MEAVLWTLFCLGPAWFMVFGIALQFHDPADFSFSSGRRDSIRELVGMGPLFLLILVALEVAWIIFSLAGEVYDHDGSGKVAIVIEDKDIEFSDEIRFYDFAEEPTVPDNVLPFDGYDVSKKEV